MFYFLRKFYNKYTEISYDEPDIINESEKKISLKHIIFKLFILLIIILFIIYYDIKNPPKRIEIDNALNETIYENNIDFSNYSSSIKPIAIYYPRFENIQDETIKDHIILAKSHGIYGFAMFYNWTSDINIYDKQIDIIMNNNNNNFNFLLIWNNDNLEKEIDKSLNIAQSIEILINNFIKKIKKYLLSSQYIKINKKPVLSINNPFIFKNLNFVILTLRQKASENGIGEIFIIFPIKSRLKQLKYKNLFDGAYDFYINNNSLIRNINSYNFSFYSELIYQNIFFNNFSNNFVIYRTSALELNNNINKYRLRYYSPEKYYILNKIIIDWTNNNFNKNNRFIFINSWNNFEEGNYLEPDEKYGYASINSFSKALFDIPYDEKIYKIKYSNKTCIVGIQAHVFYEDLIEEIINKTNNIPIKFDLYITTTTNQKKSMIETYIQKYSKANKYEILIVENKGRDVLPLITQLKDKIKNYKYICHIHTKKSKHDVNLGNRWRNYLYNNLLGSEQLITEIISEFENFEKLGIIFPEVYYEIIKDTNNYDKTNFFLHKVNINYLKYILIRIFPHVKIGTKLLFPSGNMFWAKVDAIYQIFDVGIIKLFPKELNQTNITIMHGIERIWVYLAKLNGFSYKMIFKYY